MQILDLAMLLISLIILIQAFRSFGRLTRVDVTRREDTGRVGLRMGARLHYTQKPAGTAGRASRGLSRMFLLPALMIAGAIFGYLVNFHGLSKAGFRAEEIEASLEDLESASEVARGHLEDYLTSLADKFPQTGAGGLNARMQSLTPSEGPLHPSEAASLESLGGLLAEASTEITSSDTTKNRCPIELYGVWSAVEHALSYEPAELDRWLESLRTAKCSVAIYQRIIVSLARQQPKHAAYQNQGRHNACTMLEQSAASIESHRGHLDGTTLYYLSRYFVRLAKFNRGLTFGEKYDALSLASLGSVSALLSGPSVHGSKATIVNSEAILAISALLMKAKPMTPLPGVVPIPAVVPKPGGDALKCDLLSYRAGVSCAFATGKARTDAVAVNCETAMGGAVDACGRRLGWNFAIFDVSPIDFWCVSAIHERKVPAGCRNASQISVLRQNVEMIAGEPLRQSTIAILASTTSRFSANLAGGARLKCAKTLRRAMTNRGVHL